MKSVHVNVQIDLMRRCAEFILPVCRKFLCLNESVGEYVLMMPYTLLLVSILLSIYLLTLWIVLVQYLLKVDAKGLNHALFSVCFTHWSL